MKTKHTLLITLLLGWMAFGVHAQLVVTPNSYEFTPRQINTQSEEVLFSIENQGSSPITLSPDQIHIVSQQAQSIELSILTYNIWFDNQNWPARFAHMLSEIRNLDPDIIGLQEVIQRENLDNQAQMLADSLGYYYYFSSVDAPSSPQRFGNAILSRYPITDSNWRALQPLSDYRNAAHIRIEVEGNMIDLYNTHLHNTAVNAHIREEQILDLLDFIDETSANEYIFVTGDYNANPDWDEMQIMYGAFQDVYPLFHENHLDPEHSTLNYHLGHQQRRIDYIFFNKEKMNTLIPSSAQVVIDEPDENGVYGSDHFGVMASFNILSDADAFILNNIEQLAELQAGESTEIGVIFAPFITGTNEAFLTVAEQQTPITGEGFDATVHDFPWAESFSGLENGQIPFGWVKNVENWGAFNSDYAGGEAPEMIFWWQPEQEGIFHLQTPLINTAGIDSMNLSFKHVIDNFGDPGIYNLKIISIAGEEQFVIQQWTDPASIPAEEINVQINSTDHGIGEGVIRLAWQFEGASNNIVRWAIDNILLSAEPALDVSPGAFSFEPQQINTISEVQIFTLTNIGGGMLYISPEDITLQGEDAAAFTLNNLSESIALGHMETAEISIHFHPQTVGMKYATLTLLETEIPVDGLAYDPTISAFPWHEDFGTLAGGGIPLGWTRSTINWGAFNSDNAGGEAPEMVFWWQPESSGQFYLTTPKIIASDLDTLVLSFKHRVNNFGGPGQYTLKVVAIADDTEHTIHQWVNPESIEANTFTAIIDSQSHGLGSENFHLAWVFDGITDNITQWDIDDILLAEIGDTPLPAVSPESHDFGQQFIETTSEAVEFTVQNIGGGILSISESDIFISGTHESEFLLNNIEGSEELGPFESTTVTVSFAPLTPGPKNATLHILSIEVPLSGTAEEAGGYFIYSDFSIPGFTNVEGFREVPDWAQGSITATDVADQGQFGNVILRLDYDLDLADQLTAYWMWAFPSADISGYTHLVLFAKADEQVSDVKIQIFDTSGIQGTDGAAFTHIDIGIQWQSIVIPVNDFTLMDWAENLPDMSKIQRIDLLFEESVTMPQQASVYVDMVGFNMGSVGVFPAPLALDFNLYPNPADRQVYIETEEGAAISLFDVSGKIILETEAAKNSTVLNVTNLHQGIYFVKVQSKTKTMVKKLLIK